ncbi:MAG: S8 family serine peptidase [Candidatus Hatepunaea meridiana]|nr:S8 family serine peptidase [Candidatus Hatepunaea meridiana]
MIQYDYKLWITSPRSANRISTNSALRLGAMSNISIIVILAFITFLNIAHAALKPRWTPPKPEYTVLSDDCYRYCISVKFVEDSRIRMRENRLLSLSGHDMSPFNSVMQSYKTTSLTRLFSRPEYLLEAERETGQQRSGKQLGDLNNYYRVILDSSENPERFIDDLNRLNIVEIAYAQAHYELCNDIPPETPDFSDRQGYLYEAPDGIDAVAAWEQIGGKGENVKTITIELDYDHYHEDLKALFYLNYDVYGVGNHGAADGGILTAVHNEYGVNGICPESSIGMFAMLHSVADAINISSDTIDEGDIILCEWASRAGNVQVPVEYFQENFDAIETVTANGIVFIEPASNSNADLDDERFEGRFNPERRHSVAIFVGAGAPPSGNHGEPRSRIEFSNYGSRLDLQAWGREIVTCGLGDLFYPNEDHRQMYTSNFNGTSGASAIVAGAVACLQGMCKTRTDGQILLTAEEIRDILVGTGTPQNRNGHQGHIGPQPDLAEAMEELEFPFGYLSGTITDAETEDRIANVSIRTRCEETQADEEGNWIIAEAIALGEVYITTTAEGYNDSTSVILDFEEDDRLEINMSLLHPEFILSDSSVNPALETESSFEYPFTIENNGNGFLDWSAEKTIINDSDVVDWELRNSHNAGELLDDHRLGGVVYVDDRYYIILPNT